MFDVETFEAVRKLFEQSMKTEVISRAVAPLPEPAGVYFTRVPGEKGALERHVAGRSARVYRVFRIEDVVHAIGLFGRLGPDVVEEMSVSRPPAPDAQSWFVMLGRGRVTAVANDGDDNPLARHKVVCSLEVSEPFQFLAGLHDRDMGQQGIPHRAFIRELRVALADVVPAQFVENMRMLRVTGRTGAESSVQTGKESLGRSVECSALLGDGEIPDKVTLSVNVYEDLPDEAYRQAVRCVVDVTFPDEGPLFSLIPVGGELKRAWDRTDAQIKEKIEAMLKEKELSIKVVCGSPDS